MRRPDPLGLFFGSASANGKLLSGIALGTISKRAVGTSADWRGSVAMDTDERTPDNTGNEPTPLLLIAVALVPLIAVAGWFLFG